MEVSLWISGTKKTNYQTLEKDEKADVCVIGGGIVGAITAYLLTKKGLNVIVLEKDKLCMGVTANSTAKLTSQHGLFYKYLYDEYGADFAKLYLESNENGIKLAEEIIQNENIDCDFEKKDSYVFATTITELEKVKKELNTLNKLGFDAEYVEKIEIPADNVLGAIKFKNQAQFNARKYTLQLFEKTSNLGAKIYEEVKHRPRYIVRETTEDH